MEKIVGFLVFLSLIATLPAQASPIVGTSHEDGKWEVFFARYAGAKYTFPLLNEQVDKGLFLNYSKGTSNYFCWGRLGSTVVLGRAQSKLGLVEAIENAVAVMALTGDVEEVHCAKHGQTPGLEDAVNKLNDLK